MLKQLKGLFWYYKYNGRIIVPFTKLGWTTLWSVANAWQYGVPENMDFGGYLQLIEDEVMDPVKGHEEALEVLEWSYSRTIENMAAYSYFPSGKRQVYERVNDYQMYRTVGWKQTFEWRPAC